MQASNGETKGLGGAARRGRSSWEKVVAGDWATRRHVPPTCWCAVATAEEKSRVWRRVPHWLLLGLLSTCRSSDDDPMVGSPAGMVKSSEKFTREFFRHYRGLTVVKDSRASWDDGCDG